MKKIFTGLLFSTLLLAQNTYGHPWDSDKDPCCEAPACAWGTFEVGGEWLYWRADQDSMNYASHNSSILVNNNTAIESRREILHPKFAAKSGYRFFAAYETADTNWKIGAIYTHAPSHANSFDEVPTPLTNADYIQPLIANFTLFTPLLLTNFSMTHAKWDLKVNYFDLDIQRNMSICENLNIAPHIGFRALWIKQSFHWDGIDSIGAAPHGVAKLKISGCGIEGGLMGSWNVGWGFSVIANIGGSLLYSRVNSQGVLDYIISTFPAADHYKESVHRATPMVDSFIGIAYESKLCDYEIAVRAGWESHIFFAVNEFSVNKPENLTMQGWTVGGLFGF